MNMAADLLATPFGASGKVFQELETTATPCQPRSVALSKGFGAGHRARRAMHVVSLPGAPLCR
jgi:hypothetical protein